MIGKTFYALVSVVLLSAVLVWLLPGTPRRIVIGGALTGSTPNAFAKRYKELLERQGLEVEVRETGGMVEDLQFVIDPASDVQLAFVSNAGDKSKNVDGIVSLGVVSNIPFWTICRDLEVADFSDLMGKRLAVGTRNSVNFRLSSLLLSTFGVTADSATFIHTFGQAQRQLWNSGGLDCMFQWTHPVGNIQIDNAIADPSARFVSFPMAEAFVRRHPGLIHLRAPKGIVDMRKAIPDRDLDLIGAEVRVVIKRSLHPEIVARLLQIMASEHSGPGLFSKAGEYPKAIDLEFPIAEAALDFYREGPSHIQRLVPLWAAPHVKRAIAALIALVAVVLPLLNYGPRVYRWAIRQRFVRSYKHLREIDQLQQAATAPEDVERLQTLIEALDRSVSSLRTPKRQSDLHFAFKVHVNLVRTRLASRLAELRASR